MPFFRSVVIAATAFGLLQTQQPQTPPASVPVAAPDKAPAQVPAKVQNRVPAKAPTKAPATPEPPLVPAFPPAHLVLDDNLLVTWYGNPWSNRMGILGERKGADLANGLKEQAAAYQKVTSKKVIPAYHLVAVVAQAAPGADGKYRRRETTKVIRQMLDEARANGFKLILDVQPAWSTVSEEVAFLKPFLMEPDVYLALDPEFTMLEDAERAAALQRAGYARSGLLGERKVPGKIIGTMLGKDINAALDMVEQIVAENHLPPKVVIVHQFTWNMLPDKQTVRPSKSLDIVLDMDGFGAQSLKLSTYRSILKQTPMETTGFRFTGFKLFYKQDTNLLTPAQVLALKPSPTVVIYQ